MLPAPLHLTWSQMQPATLLLCKKQSSDFVLNAAAEAPAASVSPAEDSGKDGLSTELYNQGSVSLCIERCAMTSVLNKPVASVLSANDLWWTITACQIYCVPVGAGNQAHLEPFACSIIHQCETSCTTAWGRHYTPTQASYANQHVSGLCADNLQNCSNHQYICVSLQALTVYFSDFAPCSKVHIDAANLKALQSCWNVLQCTAGTQYYVCG